MNFSSNLGVLRTRANMSQEDLAGRLGVSRQTIYKWETGQTYPDTDKLQEIANIFNVKVDDLLNDLDEEEVIYTKDEIIKNFKSFGLAIGLSVWAILLGVSVLLFLGNVVSFEHNELIGLVIMLSIIFASVLVIIFTGVKFDAFKKESLSVSFSKKEIKNNQNRFNKWLIIGIGFIFLGIIAVICFGIFDNDMLASIGVVVLLNLIGIGTCIIIREGVLNELYTNSEKAVLPDDKVKKSPADGIYGVIMLLSTIAFLVWGFVADKGWKLSWICFAVGGILCGIVSIIFDSFKKSKDNE